MAKFSGRVLTDGENASLSQSDAAQVLAASSTGAGGSISLGSAGVAPLLAGTPTSPQGVPVASIPADSGSAVPTSLLISESATAPVVTAPTPVEALSFGDAFAAAGSAMASGPLSVVDTQLAALYYANSPEAGLMSAFTGSVGQLQNAVSADGAYVLIDATAKGSDGASLLGELQALGLKGGSSFGAVASGWLPTTAIGDLASATHLASARESGFVNHAGIVTTQADHAQGNDAARATYGVDGSGFRVGVLSDSFNAIPAGFDTLATNIASDDLPVSTRILQDSTGEDEGRAMAQLIHDLAPGAGIDFATAFNGQAGFANNIIALAAAGDRVIVDDVGYFAEPAYQDGVIAQAINQVVRTNGVTYFSSSGNSGQEGYQGAWQSGATATLNGASYTLMNFAPGQDYISVTLSGSDTFVLQWDQPAASAGGVGSAVDLDVFLTDANTGAIVAGAISNNIGGDPVEVFRPIQTTGAYVITVGAKAGSPLPTNIRVLALGNGAPVNLGNPASNTNEGTVYGHSVAAEAIGVGAVSYARTPVNDYVPPVAESFTARGTTTIVFDDAGNRLATPILRSTQISAVDGGNTTFFVSDDGTDTDTFPNFYGTSAAAPDAAATAVLLLQANPNLTKDDILHLLMDSAIDEDDSATPTFDAGFDLRSGAGLIQANTAVAFAKGGIISASALGGQTTLYGTHLADTIQGGDRADTIFAGDGDDVVNGGAGNDTINGGAGADILVGGAGADTISGGLGDDVVEGGLGNDTLYAAGGFDTVVYNHASSAVTVNLAAQSATGGDGTDLVRGFYNVYGSGFGDFIIGDVNNNSLFGLDGADTVSGSDGDDIIDGGLGDDVLNGGSGDDTLSYASAPGAVTLNLGLNAAQNTGASGSDTVAGFDAVIGSSFGDTITAAGVGETIDGAGGNDVLIGAPALRETVNKPNIVKAQTTANTSSAAAVLVAPGSFDLVNDGRVSSATIIPHATITATAAGGGPEFYSFTVQAGTHALFDIDRGSFDTVISVFDSAGVLLADNDDSANDPGSTVSTDSFIDYTFAAAGTYYLAVYDFVGSSDDGVHGNLAAGKTYTLNVSLSDEAVEYTGASLPGGGAVFTGGAGFDLIKSGSGNDVIDGGADVDAVDYSLALSAVTVKLGQTTAQNTGGGGTDTISNVENVLGSSFKDTLIGSAGINGIAGMGGADVLTGGDGSDTFYEFQLSDSTPASSSSYDTITDFTHGSDKIDLTAVAGGLVELTHDNANRTIVLYGLSGGTFGGGLVATGDVEADDIIAAAGTQFVIDGSGLADKLIGGAAVDQINGNAGADLIIGSGGGDALAGGAEADIFRYLSAGDSTVNAYDTIYDFTHASDSIDLRYVSSGFVNLVHDGAGNTNVYFTPAGAAVGGAIVAVGDVEGNDLNVFGGTTIYISGSSAAETLIGGAGNDTIVGAGGVDSLNGGAGADTFLFTTVSDSTPAARDTVQDFLHLTDKVDLSRVDGGAVTITHDGAGGSILTYAFSGGTAQGSVFLTGDVEAADLITSAGAVVTTVGAFAGPDQAGADAGAAHAFTQQHFGHAGSLSSHIYAF